MIAGSRKRRGREEEEGTRKRIKSCFRYSPFHQFEAPKARMQLISFSNTGLSVNRNSGAHTSVTSYTRRRSEAGGGERESFSYNHFSADRLAR